LKVGVEFRWRRVSRGGPIGVCYNAIDMAARAAPNIGSLQDYVVSDPDRLGGEPVFVGTRVPVRSLFVYLRKGLPLEQFLDDFEGVGRSQAEAVLSLAESDILEHIRGK
jgi:uncharacterized protein (DUF433 family)